MQTSTRQDENSFEILQSQRGPSGILLLLSFPLGSTFDLYRWLPSIKSEHRHLSSLTQTPKEPRHAGTQTKREKSSPAADQSDCPRAVDEKGGRSPTYVRGPSSSRRCV